MNSKVIGPVREVYYYKLAVNTPFAVNWNFGIIYGYVEKYRSKFTLILHRNAR